MLTDDAAPGQRQNVPIHAQMTFAPFQSQPSIAHVALSLAISHSVDVAQFAFESHTEPAGQPVSREDR